MKFRSYFRVLLVLIVGAFATSCFDTKAENRGEFTANACPVGNTPGSRIDVPANAVTAVYFDAQGNPIGPAAEDLTDTKDKRMCPTPTPAGPGGCNPKPPWCQVVINNQNFCIKKNPCT